MKKQFEIEFWIGEESIDKKEYDTMPGIPGVGDNVFLMTSNEHYNEVFGEYFKVEKRQFLFIGQDTSKQKVLIYLGPISKDDFYR